MPSIIEDVAVPVQPPAPPKVVGPTTKRATRPTNKLPQWLVDEAWVAERQTFDPKKHMIFEPPKHVYTMKDIGLEGCGICPVAVSDPFPLFNEEAIAQIRAEVFSEECMKECQFASTFVQNMIRGMGPARAPFIYDAWNNPEVLSKLSQVAGIDMIPAIDYEIANINISINEETQEVYSAERPNDDVSAFAWHYDSFPLVCVVMLSDCTGMVGGETALKTSNGEIMKVRGPAMGTAVIMQGRYIEHQALKAFGGRERISMVTAFRPRSPHVTDETILTGSRPISNLSELYNQYSEYRLEVLEERFRARLKAERKREAAHRDFDIPDMRRFLTDQKQFIESMLEEIYEIEDD